MNFVFSQRSSYRLNHLPEVTAKIDDDRHKRAQMEQDVKEKLRLFQTKQGLKKDKVPGAANGNKFCQSLNNAEENSLK